MAIEAKKTAQPAILRPAEISAKSRGGGVRTIPLVTRRTGSTSFINGITIFDPGAELPLHSHNCEESVVVLSGRAIVEIDGVEQEVGAEDATFLPPNIPHRFKNASQVESMRILWTYATVDATRTIIATGQTNTIDNEHGVQPAK